MLEEMMAWQPPSGGSRPVPIGSRSIAVSLQPAIPRRVAPQQSPLPLHRSLTIVAHSRSGVWLLCSVALVVADPLGPFGRMNGARNSVLVSNDVTLEISCTDFLVYASAGMITV